MRRNFLIAAGSVLALIIVYAIYLANAAGEFRTIVNKHPQQCRPVPGLPGSEDITIHPGGKFAYISSNNRRSEIGKNRSPGAFFRYDLDGPFAAPINLTPDADLRFRPHGFSLYVGADGRQTLFVINHPGDIAPDAPEREGRGPLHTVEVFEVVGSTLTHRQTHSDELMISPNDVVGVDHERFYFTNDHGSDSGVMVQLEDYLRLRLANIVYFDGASFREAANRLSYANGINISPDGALLYVAETSRNRLNIYQRDPASGLLTHLQRIDVGFGADNIEVDPATGDLWVGGHPKLLTFVRHAAKASVLSPSQVVRVQAVDSGYQISPEFLDSGDLISGASVAAEHVGRLLIGSVFEDHIMDCSI